VDSPGVLSPADVTPAELCHSTQQRLNMYALAAAGGTPTDLPDSAQPQPRKYALAATAAGLGVLALAQPAEGKIVYTPTHIVVSTFGDVPLDLNHDGIGDFRLYHSAVHFSSGNGQSMWVRSYGNDSKNLVVAIHNRYSNLARALPAGVSIGPAMKFPAAGGIMGVQRSNTVNGTTHFYGRWANGGKGVKNRYLGLKFLISGKVHYGWARLTVTLNGKFFVETLTGYAYETIPNKSIIAGRTKGSDLITVRPATLGELALGRK
jgi:hypothetical protein